MANKNGETWLCPNVMKRLSFKGKTRYNCSNKSKRSRCVSTTLPRSNHQQRNLQMAIYDFTSPVIEIPMSKGFKSIVDVIDGDLINDSWHTTSTRNKVKKLYAANTKRRFAHETYLMHRVIMERMIGRELKRSEMIDHINGNSLDNRRANLRIATNSQNQGNYKNRSNNTSGHRGVHYCKDGYRKKCWAASIQPKGKKLIYLGRYLTKEEAIEAYEKAAKQYFGEYYYAA